MKKILLLCCVVFGAVMTVACGSPDPDPTAVPAVDVEATVAAVSTENYLSFEATQEAEGREEMAAQETQEALAVQQTEAVVPTETPAPEATAEPTAAPVAAALDSAEIYKRVSPALAFIETDTSTGSGTLLDDGYILTNAHVVYPFESVRVVFPDGTEFLDVPVAALDLMVDAALVGPVTFSAESPVLWDGSEEIIIGEDVYLIGYPAESEDFPQAALSRGLMSRNREWTQGDVTYIQTDASIAGGQSGGALVSNKGEVIGLSTYSIGDNSFALSSAMNDLLPRIDAMRSGTDLDGLMPRTPFTGESITERQGTIHAYWDYDMYMIDAQTDALELTVVSDADMTIQVIDTFGNLLHELDELDEGGTESELLELDWIEPLYVVVSQFEQGEAGYVLTSSQPMIYWDDPDERSISADNGILSGALDFPGDYDNFTLEMEAGETIAVRVESSMIDPYINIDWVGLDYELIETYSDDDSGAGPWGLNAEFEFTAPDTGTYSVVVSDGANEWTGGYYLSIESK